MGSALRPNLPAACLTPTAHMFTNGTFLRFQAEGNPVGYIAAHQRSVARIEGGKCLLCP